jgi:hypothetical protein
MQTPAPTPLLAHTASAYIALPAARETGDGKLRGRGLVNVTSTQLNVEGRFRTKLNV